MVCSALVARRPGISMSNKRRRLNKNLRKILKPKKMQQKRPSDFLTIKSFSWCLCRCFRCFGRWLCSIGSVWTRSGVATSSFRRVFGGWGRWWRRSRSCSWFVLSFGFCSCLGFFIKFFNLFRNVANFLHMYFTHIG